MSTRSTRSASVARRRRLMPLLLVTVLLGLQAVLGSPAAAQGFGDCAQPPMLERPGDGAVGSIDPPQGNGFANSTYSDYSYAGFVWHTYDQKVGPTCTDPFAELTTWVSNRVFDMAKLIVGTVNSLHYMIYNGGGVFGLDDLVERGSDALYKGVAIPFIGFALLLVAVMIFGFALKGNLASTSKATARVLVGLWLMGATALTPLLYTTITDSVLIDGVKELEANVYKQTIDDDVVYRDVLPDMLHRTVVVENWAIGEFGQGSGDYVNKMIPELLDAQAWTRDDLVTGRDADDAAEKAKHDKFGRIAEDVKKNANYAAFSGDGSSRIGASAFALVEAISFGLFQLACKLAILLAQILLRLAVLVGPVLGLLVFMPGVGRTIIRALLGVLAQGLILTVAALAHGMVLGWIIDASGFGRFGKLVLMAVITILAWKIIRPWRRLKGMASAAVGITMPNRHEQRLEDLLHRQHKRQRSMFRRLRRTAEPPHWGQGRSNGRSVPKGWGKDRQEQPRPESTPVHDGEELTDLVVSERRHRRRSDYVEGEAWPSRTPDPYRRPELARARAALPHAADRAHRTETDRGEDGGGAGGAARAERPTSTLVKERPAPDDGGTVTPRLFVPSRDNDNSDRWTDAERAETRAEPHEAEATSEDGKTVYRVYIPSKDGVETNIDRTERPETREGNH